MNYLIFLVRTATIKYLCQHSVLPTIIVTIIKVRKNYKKLFYLIYLFLLFTNAYYKYILQITFTYINVLVFK